jgi:phage antirepressor YoqD-like protein
MAPKAEVHDRTMDLLGDSMTMRNAAKILGIKPMSFGPVLAMLGIIFKQLSYDGVFQQTSVWLEGERITKTSMGGPVKRATHFRG